MSTNNKVEVSFILDPELYGLAEQVAKNSGISVQALVQEFFERRGVLVANDLAPTQLPVAEERRSVTGRPSTPQLTLIRGGCP